MVVGQFFSWCCRALANPATVLAGLRLISFIHHYMRRAAPSLALLGAAWCPLQTKKLHLRAWRLVGTARERTTSTVQMDGGRGLARVSQAWYVGLISARRRVRESPSERTALTWPTARPSSCPRLGRRASRRASSSRRPAAHHHRRARGLARCSRRARRACAG